MGTPLLESDDIVWSHETTVEHFISGKPTFPQLIMITNGFYDSSFERTIDNYQIICISGSLSQERLIGYDSQKCEISLPMNCEPLKFTSNLNNFWEQKFLIEILRKKKLPCKIFLSECSRTVFMDSHVERVEKRLSELVLTHEVKAFFLYGFTMEETKLHALNMITLPSYLALTFKVARYFKDERRSLVKLLKYMDSKIKHTMPGYAAHKDIVFSVQHGTGFQSSSTPMIVSLNETVQTKKDVKSPTRPLPPLPELGDLLIDSGLYEVLELVDRDTHKPECLPSSSNRYSQFPIIEPPTGNLKNSSETPLSKKGSDESNIKEKKLALQKELASRFNDSVNLESVSKKVLKSHRPLPPVPSLPPVPPVLPSRKGFRRHSFADTEKSCMELNKTSEVKWDLSHLKVMEVKCVLELLGLEKFIPLFQKEKVDGLILNSLTEEILTKEFNMRRIESLRLLHYIKSGHIPT